MTVSKSVKSVKIASAKAAKAVGSIAPVFTGIVTQAQITALVKAQVNADNSLYASTLKVAQSAGPISEARFKATIAPMFAIACKSVTHGAKRLSEFKIALIGMSNGLIDASTPTNFTGYVKYSREACQTKGLIAKTKKGPKARAEVKNGAGETVKAAVKESPKAISAQGALGHAHALLGNLDIAAFLVRACETGNRDQLTKYLKATFPALKE